MNSDSPDTITQTTEPPEFLLSALTDIARQAGVRFDSGSPDISGSTAQTQAGGAAISAAGADPSTAAGLRQAQQANSFLTNPDILNAESNPALASFINQSNDQLARSFNQNTLPALTGGAVATGNIGSSRQGVAEGLATQGLLNTQGTSTAGLNLQGYLAGLQALQSGVSAAPGIATAQAIPGTLQATGGSLTRQAELADFNLDNSNFQQYINTITGLLPGAGGSTTAPNPFQGPSNAETGLAAAATIIGSIYGGPAGGAAAGAGTRAALN